MSQDNPKNSDSPARTGGFGFNPRPRRRPRAALPSDGRSNEELIAEFLKTNQVTRCDTRYADGAVRTSGYYEF